VAVTTHKTICRFCHAICGIEVDIEDGRAIAVRGDRDDVMSRGYMCVKGRQLLDQHYAPGRLRGSFKRQPAGSLAPIPSERAMDEIAAGLQRIVERDGPQAVALYSGTHGLFSSAAPLIISWIRALGSPWYFTPNTIDQPAVHIAWARHGSWDAGVHRFSDADVMLFAGNNPGVSAWSQDGGPPYADGFRYLRQEQRRGLKVIALDPRRSELASRADIHLQVRPGEDPTLLAGMVRVILEEGLYDRAFVEAHVDGVEVLREAVAGYTPDYVERRSRVPAALMQQAARLFARGPRGAALASTGVNMAPRPDVTCHLIAALNSLCGRFNRAGDVVRNPGVLQPERPRYAEVIPPRELWGKGPKSRFRGLGQFMGEMPINVFADEILTPGEGQIKALVCVGGNPVVAFPDQRRVVEALRALELSVVLDVKLTATAQLAHYAVGCKLSLEKPSALSPTQTDVPFAHYTPALLKPEFDVIEEWEFFWGLAHRMGLPLKVAPGVELDTQRKPTSDEYLDQLHSRARVPLAEVRRYPSGHVFEPPEPVRVLPARPGSEAHRFNVAPQAVIEQLHEIRAEPLADASAGRFTHRLISRRMVELYNSTGDHLPGLRRRYAYNPAFLNPQCMARIGVASGDVVRIDSEHDFIYGVAHASDEVPPGVISMAHARGDLPERVDPLVLQLGSTTNRLVSTRSDFAPISGAPRQSAIPVGVRALTPDERSALASPAGN
jgi:anaerobic selenocysteine-containing dehydrogenase